MTLGQQSAGLIFCDGADCLAVFAVAVGIVRAILTFFKKLLTRTRGECISLQRLPIISYDEV